MPPFLILLPMRASAQAVDDAGLNPESDWCPSSRSLSRVSTSILSSSSFQTAFVLLLGSSPAFHFLRFFETAGAATGRGAFSVSPLGPGLLAGVFSLLLLSEAIMKN